MGAVIPCAVGIHLQMPVAGGHGVGSSWKKSCGWGLLLPGWLSLGVGGGWWFGEGDAWARGCVGTRALLLAFRPHLRVLHLVGRDKPPLGLWGEQRQVLKARGVGLIPLEAFSSRTGRSRGKDLLGAPSEDGDIHPEAKNVFIDSFIGKSPAGSCREEPPGVHLDAGLSSRAGGSEQPWLEVCRGSSGSLQTGARFPGTFLCPVAACPFTGHVLFKSLEASSLKRGQKPLVWSEAAGGSGLHGGWGPGGLYGWGIWGFFAHRLDASFLSAAPLVEFASSPREKCQVSPGGSSSLLGGAPVVVEQWAGKGGCCQRNPPKQLLWEYPHVSSWFGSRCQTPLCKHFGSGFRGTYLRQQQGFPIGRML